MTTASTWTLAFNAAYDALQPYTQHAQTRAAIATEVADVLAEYHQFGAVEVLMNNWPESLPHLNRTVLTEVVLAAARAQEEG